MTCKDCIHIDLCEDITRQKLSPERAKEVLPILRNKGKICEHYKDHSKIVELQCNIGQTVYAYCEDLHEILEYRIYCASVFRENSIIYHADCYDEENDEALSEIGFEPDDIGRTVFHTREEAEQALKERNDGNI